ncbi:MAG: viroplasmin family protein [Romboutsia sp.]|uniref:ribonuclease H1 domain-containing protein n=1 Tax=Romboutsia sp. TaxID=1965302 RepID=UPI003F2F2385
MATKKKHYAIKKGNNVSNLIVGTWEECKKYVDGVPAQYKSFKTQEEAEMYLQGTGQAKAEVKTTPKKRKPKKKKGMITLQSSIPKELYEAFLKRCLQLDANEKKLFNNLVIESLEEWIEE